MALKRSPLKRSTELKRTPLPYLAPVKPGPLAKEPKPPKGPKPRHCANKACRAPFVPINSMQCWCSPDCGVVIAQERLAKQEAKKQRAERAETKAKLLDYKPLEYWEKRAERACNEYIRARDPDICISCRVTHSSAWQAGHFISVGANSTLRYHEDNIHKQCIQCNLFKGSNAIEYEKHLSQKIGQERVDWLKGWHPPVKMTREAAQEIEAYYKAKLKALRKEKA